MRGGSGERFYAAITADDHAVRGAVTNNNNNNYNTAPNLWFCTTVQIANPNRLVLFVE